LASSNWLGKASKRMEAKGTKGAFRADAARHHLDTQAYAKKVTKPGAKASPLLKKRAHFALNAMKSSKA